MTDDDWRLILIKQKSVVGSVLEDHQIYKVSKIIIVPLSDAEPQELDLDVSVHCFESTNDNDQYSGAMRSNYLSLYLRLKKFCFLYIFIDKYHINNLRMSER